FQLNGRCLTNPTCCTSYNRYLAFKSHVLSLSLLNYSTCNKSGKNVEIIGIYVINNKTMIDAIKNGIIALDKSNNDDPEIPLATYRFKPTGGVNKPIAKLTVIKTPNAVGSISKWIITGNNIGTKI